MTRSINFYGFINIDKSKWVRLKFKKKEKLSGKVVEEEYHGEVKDGIPYGY